MIFEEWWKQQIDVPIHKSPILTKTHEEITRLAWEASKKAEREKFIAKLYAIMGFDPDAVERYLGKKQSLEEVLDTLAAEYSKYRGAYK